MNAPTATFAVPSFLAHATPAGDLGFPSCILAYGDGGRGKTKMTADLVVAGFFRKVVLLNLDNGAEVLASDKATKDELFDPETNPNGRIIVVTVDPVMDPHAFLKVDAMICEMVGAAHPTGPDGKPIYTKFVTIPNAPAFDIDLVALDTLNLFQDVAVKFFQSITVNQYGKPDTLKAWGEVGIYTDAVARLFQNTNRFTGVLLMHHRIDTENTGKVSIKPKLSGGVKDSIATIPSLVTFLDFEQRADGVGTTLVGVLGESDTYVAKNRYGLEPKMTDFSLVKLYEAISEKIGKPLPNYNPQPVAAIAA